MDFKEFSLAKVSGIVKKKPVLIAGGLAVILGAAAWYAKSNSTGDSLEYAAGDITDSASGSETEELDLSGLEDLLSKLEDVNDKKYEDFALAQSNYLSDMFAGIESQIAAYTQRQEVIAPQVEVESLLQKQEQFAPAAQEETLLQKQISNILSTNNLLVETGYNFTESDIASMSNWATEEKKAVSSGSSGTSKNPTGFSGIVTYGKDNTVTFGSGKTSSGGAAVGSNTYASANKAVSSITGKSGSIESQLSGKSQSEKMSILKAAGLV